MHLLLRADSSPAIGAGHVMRCLALAQAWQDAGHDATFLSATQTAMPRARLRQGSLPIRHMAADVGTEADALQTVETARPLAAAWVVVDGYRFGTGYRRVIREAGLKVLAIDDIGFADSCEADLVLNQNLHAHAGLYAPCGGGPELLLGTRYALLRREFTVHRGLRRDVPEVGRKLLVTLGGAGAEKATGTVMEALEQVHQPRLRVRVVAPSSHDGLQPLVERGKLSGHDVRLLGGASDMSKHMAWADAAVSGAGSTCWELAYMGVPSLLVTMADNQRAVADGLQDRRAAVRLGWHADVSPQAVADAVCRLLLDRHAREDMILRGREIVDGAGGERVVAKLLANVEPPTAAPRGGE